MMLHREIIIPKILEVQTLQPTRQAVQKLFVIIPYHYQGYRLPGSVQVAGRDEIVAAVQRARTKQQNIPNIIFNLISQHSRWVAVK